MGVRERDEDGEKEKTTFDSITLKSLKVVRDFGCELFGDCLKSL